MSRGAADDRTGRLELGPGQRIGLALLAVFLLALPSAAQERRLAALFPTRAELLAEGDGPHRLSLSAEILAACRSDLSDLRLLDAAGRELPYAIDSGLLPGFELELSRTLKAPVLEVERQRRDSTDSPSLYIESFELVAPSEASPTGYWDLALETRRPRFVRQVRVEAVAADGSLRELETDRSLFRLEEPRREKLELTLPQMTAEKLRVTLEGEEGGYLEPTFRYHSSQSLPIGETALVELVAAAVTQAGGKTTIELERPRGLVPDALVIDTATELFRRRVEVYDTGPGGSGERLAEATLFRLERRGGPEERELSLEPATGDRLRLEIEDGDSPPLTELTVSARLRRPTLLFTLPAAEDGARRGWLLFGGGRAYRPQYDLAALLPLLPAVDREAETAAILRRGGPGRSVRLGAVEPNPEFDPAPALGFAMRAGAELDRRLFSHRRPLMAPSSAEGLVRLDLELADQAVARSDLADLRIVDGDGRQRSYLIEPGARRRLLELPIAEPESEDGVSVYRLSLPSTPVVIDRLELETEAAFFDRPFELVAQRAATDRKAAGDVRLASGRLERRVGDPSPIVLHFAPQRIEALELRVTDGDDAPLLWLRARGGFPLAALFFAVPSGEYALLIGSPEAAPPSYELSRARDLVLAAASVAVETGDLGRNPDYSSAVRWTSGAGLGRGLVWGGLLVAVVVLTALTLRLARSESTE